MVTWRGSCSPVIGIAARTMSPTCDVAIALVLPSASSTCVSAVKLLLKRRPRLRELPHESREADGYRSFADEWDRGTSSQTRPRRPSHLGSGRGADMGSKTSPTPGIRPAPTRMIWIATPYWRRGFLGGAAAPGLFNRTAGSALAVVEGVQILDDAAVRGCTSAERLADHLVNRERVCYLGAQVGPPTGLADAVPVTFPSVGGRCDEPLLNPRHRPRCRSSGQSGRRGRCR